MKPEEPTRVIDPGELEKLLAEEREEKLTERREPALPLVGVDKKIIELVAFVNGEKKNAK